jgi:hypothetical protein
VSDVFRLRKEIGEDASIDVQLPLFPLLDEDSTCRLKGIVQDNEETAGFVGQDLTMVVGDVA